MATLDRGELTSDDLKDSVHDIQDNVVTPILMRYGRHIFLKFTDGAKAREWLGNMFARVNARGQSREPLHRQHRLHARGAQSFGGLATVIGQLSRGVPSRHAGPRRCRGRCRPARA